MYRILPLRYEIYPGPDGEIAIHAPGNGGRSVILSCESDGNALCLVDLRETRDRKRYPTADDLPDDFVDTALTELKNCDNRAA